jgi:large subunit ribosomal protein L9
MKVTLLQTVKGLGVRGDTKEVADGYALNFLLRQNLAVAGTRLPVNAQKQPVQTGGKQSALKRQLTAKALNLEALVHDNDELYGSIGAEEVIKAAQEQAGATLLKKQLTGGLPLKTLGTHEIEVTADGQRFIVIVKLKALHGQKK